MFVGLWAAARHCLSRENIEVIEDFGGNIFLVLCKVVTALAYLGSVGAEV